MMNTYGRNKKNTRPIMIMLVISRIVIIGGVVWFIFDLGASDSPENGDNQEEQERWYVGENVLLQGELEEAEDADDYTHTFTSRDGDIFGAKSSEVDLFSNEGNVEIRGEIVDIIDEIPVISVSELVDDTSGDDTDEGEITLQGNPSLYYSLQKGLMIDLSISDGYDVVETDTGLSLVDRSNDNKEMLYIEDFVCQEGDPLQDCEALRERFIEFNNESFTNALGVTFYNLTETNTWFAFNGNEKGYTVRATDQNQIATFASLIGFLSEDILDDFLVENKAKCSSIDSSMETINQVAYQDQGNGLFSAVIQGVSNTGGDASCRAVIKVGSPFQMEVVEYDAEPGTQQPEEDSEETNDTENEDTQEDTTEEDTQVEENDAVNPPSSNVERPESFDGWLQYSSVRGFIMWFSQQGVSYFGSVLESPTNLGQEGVSCPYKVNVIEWQNADNVENNPDIVVYECTGVDVNDLPENTQFVGQSGENYFLARWYSNDLAGMDIYVEQAPEEEEETE